jgi:hypothetical protein
VAPSAGVPVGDGGGVFSAENDGAAEQIRYIPDLIAVSVNSKAPKVPENTALSGLGERLTFS